MVVEAQRLPVESRRTGGGRGRREQRSAHRARRRSPCGGGGNRRRRRGRARPRRGRAARRARARPEGSALAAEVAGTRAAWMRSPRARSRSRRGGRRNACARRRRSPCPFEPPAASSARSSSCASPRTSAPRSGASRSSSRAQVALAVRTLAHGRFRARQPRARWLELAGEALAAGGDPHRAAQQAVRLAVETTGARGGALWRVGREPARELVASVRRRGNGARPRRGARARGGRGRGGRPRSSTSPGCPAARPTPRHCRSASRRSPRCSSSTARISSRPRPTCRRSPRSPPARRTRCAPPSAPRDVELELERTRALLEVVGEAISRLSLAAHARDGGRADRRSCCRSSRSASTCASTAGLLAAAGRGLSAGHEEVAARLQDALAGRCAPARRSTRAPDDTDVGAQRDTCGARRRRPDRRGRRPAARARRVDRTARRVPGRASARRERHRIAHGARARSSPSPCRTHGCTSVRRSSASALRDVLESERQTSRQVNALYEISRSFAQSLSLETTLEAVTSTIVEVLGGRRGRHPRARRAWRPVRAARRARGGRRVWTRRCGRSSGGRSRGRRARPRPLVLDVAAARRLGGAHALLVPFLEKGSTAALLPIATPTELLAQLTILSLDPARPIDAETLATAGTIAAQAALAIDNARLYQQQKAFAETMQRSLLPRELPARSRARDRRRSTSRPRRSTSAATSSTSSSCPTTASRSFSATSPGTGSTRPPTWRWRSSSSARSRASTPSRRRVPRARERGRRRRDRGRQVHHDGVPHRRPARGRCAARAPAIPRRGSSVPTAPSPGSSCGGLALGIDRGAGVRRRWRAELPAGGAVVLYTDGVIESRRGRELFGVRAPRRRALRARDAAGAGARRCACSRPAARSPAATSPTTARSSSSAVVKLRPAEAARLAPATAAPARRSATAAPRRSRRRTRSPRSRRRSPRAPTSSSSTSRRGLVLAHSSAERPGEVLDARRGARVPRASTASACTST